MIINTNQKFYLVLFRTVNKYSPPSLTIMSTVNTEFSHIEVWFTDQANKALEIEDSVNLM